MTKSEQGLKGRLREWRGAEKDSTVRGRQNRKQQSEQAEKNQAENGRERLRKIDEGKARAAQGRIEKVHRTENKIFRQNRSW